MNSEQQEALNRLSEQLHQLADSLTKTNKENPANGVAFMAQLGGTYLPLLKRCGEQILHQPQLLERLINELTHDLHTLIKAAREKPDYQILNELHALCKRSVYECVSELNLSKRDKAQFRLCLDFAINYLAPKNHLWGNRDAKRLTKKQSGVNLIQGLSYLAEDIVRWQGHLNLTKTTMGYFQLGKNIGCTPSEIVLDTDVMQLLHYHPVTEKKHPIPLLLVTSWINKYYILDLSPRNSSVQWWLNHGYDVFIINWKDPSQQEAHLGFEDYVLKGPVAALKAIENLTGQKQAHGFGYCLGGTLMSAANAYLSASNSHRLASLTTVASMVDFSEPGAIGHLMGPEQVALYEEVMQKDCNWDGQKMHLAFNLTDSERFIWPFAVRRYLHGKKPMRLDTLFWGLDLSDTTRALYQFYMHDLHLNNRLVQPGALHIQGIPLDIHSSQVPWFCLGFESDRTSPWASCFKTCDAYQGPVQKVLSQGEHLTGVLNADSLSCQVVGKSTETTKDWRLHWLAWMNNVVEKKASPIEPE